MTIQRSFKPLVLGIIAISIVSLFATCSQTLVLEDSAGFTLTLPSGGGARALSKFDAVATWRISGSNVSNGSDFVKDFSAADQTVVIDNISPGAWQISVAGLDTGGVRVFYASANSNLVAGYNILNISMVKDPLVNGKIAVEGPIYYLDLPGPLVNNDAISFGEISSYPPVQSRTITFSITNTGNSDLILKPALTYNDQDFLIPAVPISPVPPSNTIALAVIFDPKGSYSHNDTLTIVSNDPDIPEFVLNLSGTYC